jgi:RNA polymerase sigma-70 factor (ECF subfamily)
MTRNPTPDVETFLLEESAALRALALSLVGSADADDCVQDAWVAAIRTPPRRNPAAWLRTVVRNLAFRKGRDAARRRRREVRSARGEALPSVAEAAERREVRRLLLAAVDALDEPYRSTVTLRYFEGLTPTEIARTQGIPVKTVKTRLARALDRLRLALDEAHGGRRRAWAPVLLAALSGAAPAGGVIAMKKVAVAVVALLLLGGGAWWATSAWKEEAPDLPEAGGTSLAGEPALRGAPAPETAVAAGPSSDLRDGDAVPLATFAGRVVDEEGRGVPGARVALHWLGVREGATDEAVNGMHVVLRRERERREAPATHSGPEGYFRLDRPYGSTSLLVVEKEGFVPRTHGPLSSGTFALVRLTREGGLRVRALREDGQPVAGAEVRLATADTWSRGREVLAAAVTDEAGWAALPDPGESSLLVEVVPREPDLGIGERRVVATDSEVEVRLPAVRVVERRILSAETRAPVPGAFVDVLRAHDQEAVAKPHGMIELFRRRILADRDGNVRFPWQDGYYSAYASAPGHEVVHAWEDPILLTRAGSVEGVVLDAEGRGVEGAAILVVIPDGGAFHESAVGRRAVAAWSGADGGFTLEFVLPHGASGKAPPDRGVRTLLALHPDHPPAVLDRVPVTPGRRERVTLRFEAPGAIEIELVDPEEHPIAGQWLWVARRVPRAPSWPEPAHAYGSAIDTVSYLRPNTVRTDEAGRATATGLPPGLHLVRAENTEAEVEVRAGETVALRIVKGGGPYLSGRLVDAQGEPVAGAQVGISGPAAAVKTTDAEGRFRFDDLPPGEYGIGARVGRLFTNARARTGQEVVLRLPAGPARLFVTIEGPPPEATEYSLFTETGGAFPPGTGFTEVEGSAFETPEFNPGTGVLVVRAKGYGWTAVRFDAHETTTTAVRVVLEPAGSVRVRVDESILALERESRRGLLRLARTDGWLRAIVGDEDPRVVTGGVTRLMYAIQRSRGNADEFGHEPTDGVFSFPDLTPGPYEASYGHFEEDGGWVSRAAVPVEVRSGAAAEVDLRR